MERIEERCAFCSSKSSERKLFFSGIEDKNVYICDNCCSIFYNTIPMIEGACRDVPKINTHNEDNEVKFDMSLECDELTEINESETVKKPMDIYKELNECVIGQDKAKKTLAVALYNHWKRINDTTGKIKKSNILMAGPSGCGKTLIAQTLANVIDVPFTVADATSITETGYVGNSVEDILLNLIYKADGDVKKAMNGIVYIDEIDKLANRNSSSSGQRDIKGEGVQQALLKLVEGSEVILKVPSKNPHSISSIKFDTRNILFVAGGAFEGMLNSEIKKAFGFNSCDEEIGTTTLSQETLKDYGMIREIIGRFPVLVQLNELTEDEMVQVLSIPKNCLVEEYKELMQKDGIELIFDEGALREIARTAIERKIGARGLRSIMEEIMNDIMFSIPSDETATKCIITKDCIFSKIPVIEHS